MEPLVRAKWDKDYMSDEDYESSEGSESDEDDESNKNDESHQSLSSFNFLALPPELRNRIYEMCVYVLNYIAYDERDCCTCVKVAYSTEDVDHDRPCRYRQTCARDRHENHRFRPRVRGPYYAFSYSNDSNRESFRPPILESNSQIRKEAVPVFYAVNDFVFEDCEARFITRWILNAVQPEHLKHLRSITYNGNIREVVSYNGRVHRIVESAEVTHSETVNLCSVMMLMQLGVLGKCKVSMVIDHAKELHVACNMHKMIKEMVRRRDINRKHALNEKGDLDEVELAGLVYAVSRRFARWYHDILSERGEKEANCACSAQTASGHAPQVVSEQLASALEKDDHTAVTEAAASVPLLLPGQGSGTLILEGGKVELKVNWTAAQ